MTEVTLIAGRAFDVAGIRKRIDTRRKETWDPELAQLLVIVGALLDAYWRERRGKAEPVGYDGNGSPCEEFA